MVLSTSAVSVSAGIWPSAARRSVVLPVPTSPVSSMKPFRRVIPYTSDARPS